MSDVKTIQMTAVAVMRETDDDGLEPEWFLEGGTAELEEGMYLLVAENASALCEEDGGAEVYSAEAYDALAQQLASEKLHSAELIADIEVEKAARKELAQQLAVCKVQLQTTQIALQDSNGAVVELRQQLAASQASELELRTACVDLSSLNRELDHKMDYFKGFKTQLTEAQATITRLEAMATERDKQLAEAVGIVREIQQSCELSKMRDGQLYNFLAKHEGKENG